MRETGKTGRAPCGGRSGASSQTGKPPPPHHNKRFQSAQNALTTTYGCEGLGTQSRANERSETESPARAVNGFCTNRNVRTTHVISTLLPWHGRPAISLVENDWSRETAQRPCSICPVYVKPAGNASTRRTSRQFTGNRSLIEISNVHDPLLGVGNDCQILYSSYNIAQNSSIYFA